MQAPKIREGNRVAEEWEKEEKRACTSPALKQAYRIRTNDQRGLPKYNTTSNTLGRRVGNGRVKGQKAGEGGGRDPAAGQHLCMWKRNRLFYVYVCVYVCIGKGGRQEKKAFLLILWHELRLTDVTSNNFINCLLSNNNNSSNTQVSNLFLSSIYTSEREAERKVQPTTHPMTTSSSLFFSSIKVIINFIIN